MSIKTISPLEALEKLEAGATLIDIRGSDEHARERISRARNVPLEGMTATDISGDVLLFHCKSGMRTRQAAERLKAMADGRDCYIVDGGLDGWSRAGLPIERVKGAPLPMQRQVMIAAGSLVLLGTLLSLTVAPAFVYLALFVGAGLTFAGISGFCGMAYLLAAMPWNRARG